MKKLVLVLASAAIAHTGFSQITIDPEAGANFSTIRTKIGDNDATTSDNATGFNVGVGVNMDLGSGLYVKPGLNYQLLGGKTEVAGVTTTTSMHYLQVPVNLGYRYHFSPDAGSIFVEAGPYIGYALSGKNKIEGLPTGDIENDITFGSEDAETNPFDWGFNFNLGYETPWGVYVKGGYGLGLGNLSNVADVTNNINRWNVGVGYRIKL
ncbi:MAG: PorT family protein [Taibaiella sp.]|nr:PorT family protein [Taibaiella sp.]